MESVRIEADINGQGYQLVCKPWPYKVGRRWLTRLLAMMSPGLGAGDVDFAVSEILGQVTPELLEQLTDECERHTDAVPLEGGTAVPFAELTPLLRGRYDVTLRVVRTHVELQFTPFFASLPSVLAGPDQPPAEAIGAASSSSRSPAR